MRAAKLAAAIAVLLLGAAAPLSPMAEWKKGIADENKDYAQVPHAMLKIQDSAYIGEGQKATLLGRAGDPQSWRWSGGGKPKQFDVSPDPKAKLKPVLEVSIAGGKLSVTKDGKALDPALMTKSIPIDKDVDVAGQTTQVGAGVHGWRIFVYNQRNPAATQFTGVSYYPFDPAFRVTARFTPDAKLPPRVFRTSRGTDKQFFHAGDAHFTLKGKPVTLAFYTDSNEPAKIDDMSAFFHDGLTGKGAYGAGRYVDVEKFGKFPPAQVTIDFNQAYNPNCARSAHFTCPLAQDMIPLEVAAGERDPHQAH